MEKAEQEVTVGIRMLSESLEEAQQHRGSKKGFKLTCALVSLTGLLAVALVGILIYVFLCIPSCNQEASQENNPANIRLIREFKAASSYLTSQEIFTVEKAAHYLIYGWLRFSSVPNVTEKASLICMDGKLKRTLQKKLVNSTEIFFFVKFNLSKDMTVSVTPGPNCIDGFFHVYEL